MVRMAKSFGMRVFVYDPVRRQTLADLLDFEYLPLERLLGESDIVSLHCPASDATRHMINRASLSSMKRGAILINTARGELVDTAALLEALQSGHIGGAGLDVFEAEAVVREEAQILSKAYDRQQLEAPSTPTNCSNATTSLSRPTTHSTARRPSEGSWTPRSKHQRLSGRKAPERGLTGRAHTSTSSRRQPQIGRGVAVGGADRTSRDRCRSRRHRVRGSRALSRTASRCRPRWCRRAR